MSDETRPVSPKDPSPRRQRQKQGGGWLKKLALACSILTLVLAGISLYMTLVRKEEPPEPVTFSYRDRILGAKEGLPVNEYDRAGFTLDELGRISFQKDGQRARFGIDVSFYQGEIDWTAVAADGVEFAMVRLGYRGYTEGGLQMDSRFQENMQGAREAGLEVGVYFFSQALNEQEAEEEADFVLNVLKDYEITYPVAFDWEFITPGKEARTDCMDGLTLTRCAQSFCSRIQEAGYTPTVYFNQDMGYLTYALEELGEYLFWLAEYDSRPDFYYCFGLWQYTHTGSVAGIQGNVDLNLDLRPVNSMT